jgi:hypothetical protein
VPKTNYYGEKRRNKASAGQRCRVAALVAMIEGACPQTWGSTTPGLPQGNNALAA